MQNNENTSQSKCNPCHTIIRGGAPSNEEDRWDGEQEKIFLQADAYSTCEQKILVAIPWKTQTLSTGYPWYSLEHLSMIELCYQSRRVSIAIRQWILTFSQFQLLSQIHSRSRRRMNLTYLQREQLQLSMNEHTSQKSVPYQVNELKSVLKNSTSEVKPELDMENTKWSGWMLKLASYKSRKLDAQLSQSNWTWKYFQTGQRYVALNNLECKGLPTKAMFDANFLCYVPLQF